MLNLFKSKSQVSKTTLTKQSLKKAPFQELTESEETYFTGGGEFKRFQDESESAYQYDINNNAS